VKIEVSRRHGAKSTHEPIRSTAGTDMKVTGWLPMAAAISQAATLTYDGKDCAITCSPRSILWR